MYTTHCYYGFDLAKWRNIMLPIYGLHAVPNVICKSHGGHIYTMYYRYCSAKVIEKRNSSNLVTNGFIMKITIVYKIVIAVHFTLHNGMAQCLDLFMLQKTSSDRHIH
jgi:hypothetical protein